MQNSELIALCKKKLIAQMQKTKILEKKLKVEEEWMHKEVKTKNNLITVEKVEWVADYKNLEENVKDNIIEYFWEILLLNAPAGTIESLITSEINYSNVIKMDLDWFSVIWGYHKVLDLFIENIITKNFRKFAKKEGQTILRINDPLEKALHLIVNKWYILSAGRLFALMKIANEWSYWWDYVEFFKKYLNKPTDVSDLLTDQKFYKTFEKLNKSGLLSAKRHSWVISKAETIEARKMFVWDYKNKNSILYKIMEYWSVMM